VVKTSQEGGCHIWLSCTCNLGEWERHQAQRWLAPLAGADIASTSGEHLGRLAGFKSWKRNGTWVNVVAASRHSRCCSGACEKRSHTHWSSAHSRKCPARSRLVQLADKNRSI
jgi:hypothetical protein